MSSLSSGNVSPRQVKKKLTLNYWLCFLCGTCVGFLASTMLWIQHQLSSGPGISPLASLSAPLAVNSPTTTMFMPRRTAAAAKNKQQQESDPGWNLIHVFYGQHMDNHTVHLNNNNNHHPTAQMRSNNNNTTTSTTTNHTSTTTTTTPRRWFSQAQQDEFVSRLLRHKQDGYFVDLAANDARRISNTYALETFFHWQGLCIEPNPLYWEGLALYRPHCRIVAAVVGRDLQPQAVRFQFPHRAAPRGGMVGPAFDRHEPSRFGEDQWRYTVPLALILERFQAPTVIDYLSLDIEGAETFVLEKFPFDRYRFHVMTIERPDDTLCRLLVKHGYRLLKQLKKRLGETVWIHQELLSPDKSSLIDLSVVEMDTEHYKYSETIMA